MDKKNNKNPMHSVFDDNAYFLFLYKKTEKIVTAVHLVTNHIKDEDTIKWHLRKRSLDLLSDILTLYHFQLSDRKQSGKVLGLISEILSLFDIAHQSHIVSEMNATIMKREVTSLFVLIEEQVEGEGVAQSLILSDEFFDTPSSENSIASNNNSSLVGSLPSVGDAHKGHYKRHEDMSFKTRLPAGAVTQKKSQKISADLVKDKGEERRKIILDILTKSQNIGVNELIGLITDCSEKTIQRQLLSMVKEGVLKKEGERRWSRYSRV